eukprot:gnl/TRDRNA2_/TRDRNA2_130865_c0_seq1.p1 gnl/TRDRNA2_/TRDRNA2_130865_c0~~gnl/TRDRNA2_/TRDRNA2_130865_c0_seq1.p1  ORF type:complete len:320 (+),score=49.25 gnl/TRDRNA2_/TRDRNA2_130865_c0_seq1:76-1035(+)
MRSSMAVPLLLGISTAGTVEKGAQCGPNEPMVPTTLMDEEAGNGDGIILLQGKRELMKTTSPDLDFFQAAIESHGLQASPSVFGRKVYPTVEGSNWHIRNHAISELMVPDMKGQLDFSDRDVFEFGVYLGHGMHEALGQFSKAGVKFRNLWGFDSFRGLPEDQVPDKQWKQGEYNPTKQMPTGDIEDAQQTAMATISYPNTNFIVGWYNESLTSGLAEERTMKPALFVDVDCDMYSSTFAALDWLFSSHLVAQGETGTYFYFDDVVFGRQHPTVERQAMDAITKKYNISWDDLTSRDSKTFKEKWSEPYLFKVLSYSHL